MVFRFVEVDTYLSLLTLTIYSRSAARFREPFLTSRKLKHFCYSIGRCILNRIRVRCWLHVGTAIDLPTWKNGHLSIRWRFLATFWLAIVLLLPVGMRLGEIFGVGSSEISNLVKPGSCLSYINATWFLVQLLPSSRTAARDGLPRLHLASPLTVFNTRCSLLRRISGRVPVRTFMSL